MTAELAREAANADQIAYWNTTAGETWAAMQARMDRQIAPLGEMAIAALDPSPGEAIIDIGCGCGQTTLELARRVGPGGAVMGVDISAPMLAVARARPLGGDLGKISFAKADAQTFAFEPAASDAAFSRFGVMFFEDPRAAFVNIRAALAPGGRLAFVCWRDIALNPFMTIPFQAAAPLLGPAPPPADPLAPGPFAFADGARLVDILKTAGFVDIALQAHDQAIGSGDIDETLETALRIGPLGRALREQPHLAEAVRGAVRSALAPFATPAGVLIDSASWIVTARNPRREQ